MLLLILLNPFFNYIFSGSFGRFLGFQGTKVLSIWCLLNNIIIVFYSFWFLLNNSIIQLIFLGNWIFSSNFVVHWNFNIEPLTIIMLLVVNSISFLVHLFSTKYMENDAHLIRFMSYISLFTFFMLILIFGDNLFILFFGWEGVGLCSYLLISFWYTRVQANKSALKAVIVNRISDFGLTLGIIVIFYFALTIEFTNSIAILNFLTQYMIFLNNTTINCYILTIISLLLFVGAVGKSAQIFLHTWLPDAMEGPTPVSALIHAATMVTAGVYLIIKCSNIIENSYTSLNIIACFGAVTAFFAASSGLFLSDIKKIIAYSTCSQLGYMIFACGISAYNVSLFHLMNHAVFKALLFLGAGAIIHSVSNEQDIRRMGNLIKILPMTYCTFLIATLAIIGFPFLTGFFSKDMIIENTFGFYSTKSLIMHFFAVLTALFTAIYSFKILYFVFFIKTNLLKSYTKNLHESEMAMGLPLILLAIGSVFIGFIFKDIIIGTGSNFFQTGVSIKLTKHIETEFITILSKLFPFIATGLGGLILILYLILYKKNNIFYTVFVYKKLFFFTNKWNFDRVYNFFINYKIMIFAFKNIYKNLDKGILEKFGPFGISQLIQLVANKLNFLQTGRIENYLQFMVLLPVIFSLILLKDFYTFEIYHTNIFLIIFPNISTINYNIFLKKFQNLLFEFLIGGILINIMVLILFQIFKKYINIFKSFNTKHFVKYLKVHFILFKIIKFKNWIKWNQQIKNFEKKTQKNVNYKLDKNFFFWNSKLYDIYGSTTILEETKIFSQIWDLQDTKWEIQTKLQKQFKSTYKFKKFTYTIKNYIQKLFKIYEIPQFKWRFGVLFKKFLRKNLKNYNQTMKKEIHTLASDIYSFLMIYNFIRKQNIYINMLTIKLIQNIKKFSKNFVKNYAMLPFSPINKNFQIFIIYFFKFRKLLISNDFILFGNLVVNLKKKQRNSKMYFNFFRVFKNNQNLNLIYTLQKKNKQLKNINQILKFKKFNGQKYSYNLKKNEMLLFNNFPNNYPQLFENGWIPIIYKSKNLIKLNKNFKINKKINKIIKRKIKKFKFKRFHFKKLTNFKLNTYKLFLKWLQIKVLKKQNGKINIEKLNKEKNIHTYKISNTFWSNYAISRNFNQQNFSNIVKKVFKNLNYIKKTDLQVHQIQNIYWKNLMWLKTIKKNKKEWNILVKKLRKLRLNTLFKKHNFNFKTINAFYPNLLKKQQKKNRALFSFFLFYYILTLYNRIFWKYSNYNMDKQKKIATQMHTFFWKRWLLICWIVISMTLWNPFYINKKPIIWIKKKTICLKKEPEFENEEKITEFIKTFNVHNENNIKTFSSNTSYENFIFYNFIDYFRYFWPKTYKIFESLSFILFCIFFGIFLFTFFFISYTKIGQFLILEWNIISGFLQNTIFEVFIENYLKTQQKYTYITYFINLFIIIFFNILLLMYIKKKIKNIVLKQYNKTKTKFPIDFTLNLTKILNFIVYIFLLVLTSAFWLHIISIYLQILYFTPIYRWFFPHHSHNYPQNFFWYNQNILTFFELFQGSDITIQKWRNQYIENWKQRMFRGLQKKEGESIFVYQKWQYNKKQKKIIDFSQIPKFNKIYKFWKKYIFNPGRTYWHTYWHTYFSSPIQKNLKKIGQKINSNIYNFGKIYKKNEKKITWRKRRKFFGNIDYPTFVKLHSWRSNPEFIIEEPEEYPNKRWQSKYFLHWEYEYGMPWITKKQLVNFMKEDAEDNSPWNEKDEELGESLSWNDKGFFDSEKYTEWDNTVIIPYKTISIFKNYEKYENNNHDLSINFLKPNNLQNIKDIDIKQSIKRNPENAREEFLKNGWRFTYNYISRKIDKKNNNLFFKRIWKFEKKNIIETKLKTKQIYNKNLNKFQKYSKIKPHLISVNCDQYYTDITEELVNRRVSETKFEGNAIMKKFLTWNQNELKKEILYLLYDLLIDLRMELWERKKKTDPIVLKYPLLETNVEQKKLNTIQEYKIEELSADFFLKYYYDKVLKNDLWDRTINFDPINHYPLIYTSYQKLWNHIFYLENFFLNEKIIDWNPINEEESLLFTPKDNDNIKFKTAKIVTGVPFLSKDFIEKNSYRLWKPKTSEKKIYWTCSPFKSLIVKMYLDFKQMLYDFDQLSEKSAPRIRWHFKKQTKCFEKRLKRQRIFSIYKTKIINLNLFFNNYNGNNKITLKAAKNYCFIKTKILHLLNDLKTFQNIYIQKLIFCSFFLINFFLCFQAFYKIGQIKYKWIEQKKIQIILKLLMHSFFFKYLTTQIINKYIMFWIKHYNMKRLKNIFIQFQSTNSLKTKIFVNIINFFINKKIKQIKKKIRKNHLKVNFFFKTHNLKPLIINLKKHYPNVVQKNLNFWNKKLQKPTYKQITYVYKWYKTSQKIQKF